MIGEIYTYIKRRDFVGKHFENKRRSISRYYNFLLIIVGILSVLYCFFCLSLGWGFYFGLKAILILGIFLFVHGVLRKYNKLYISSLIEKWINVGIILILAAFTIMEGLILAGAYINDIENIDYILVLGAGIVDDRPSLELRYRLDTAIDFIKENPDKKIILCGGKGGDEKFSEAYVMEKYLKKHGIRADIIIKEEKSKNTYENIKYAKEIIETIDSRSNIKVAISSSDFHLFRAKLIAKRLGLKAAGLPSKTPLYIIPNHHVREYFAIIKSIFLE